MAGIFSERQAESINQAINTTVGVFRERFDKKQFDDFQQNEYADYQSELQKAQQIALTSDDPEEDGLAQSFQVYKSAQNKLFTMASKYKDNPYISNLMNLHLEHDKNMFDQMVTAEEKSHALSRRGMLEEREGREAEADIGQKQASTEALQQQTQTSKELMPLKIESEKALAEQRRAVATKAAGAAKTPYFGYITGDIVPPEQVEQMAGNPAALQGVRSIVEANISRRDKSPMGQALRQEEDEILRGMAKQYINTQIQAGKQRESGVDWDYSLDSIRSAISLVDRDEAKQEHVRRRMIIEGQRFGFSPQEIQEQSPDLFRPLISEHSGIPPITDKVNYGEVATRIFGSDLNTIATSLHMEDPTDVLNPKRIVEQIEKVDSLGKLPMGSPIAAPFLKAIATGGFHPDDPDVQFSNYNDLLKYLIASSEQHVRINLGGIDAEDSEVNKSVREARTNTRKIFNAAIKKFAPETARKLNLKGAPKSQWQLIKKETGLSRILGE